jgi:phage head maturation protease
MKHTMTEGPLGFPMTDRQAITLGSLLKTLPRDKEHEYRKKVFLKAPTSVSTANQPENWDVSWISTEAPDRYNEVVIAKGMNDSQFALNPIVTLNHDYSMPPIGRSLWRKLAKEGNQRGIQAKTVYPPRPDGWTDPWAPDNVFALVQAGLLNAKSIGWLPTKVHYPDPKEASANGWNTDTMVIDEWLLVEYAVGTIPVNPETVVNIVSKTMPSPQELAALGWDAKLFERGQVAVPETKIVSFTPWAEVEKWIERKLATIEFARMASNAVERTFGKV